MEVNTREKILGFIAISLLICMFLFDTEADEKTFVQTEAGHEHKQTVRPSVQEVKRPFYEKGKTSLKNPFSPMHESRQESAVMPDLSEFEKFEKEADKKKADNESAELKKQKDDLKNGKNIKKTVQSGEMLDRTPILRGIVSDDKSRLAILEIGGKSFVLASGDMAEGTRVGEIAEHYVILHTENGIKKLDYTP